MPHLTLEYSANVPPPDDLAAMLHNLHQALHSIGGIRIENCKSRVRVAQEFHIANGEEDGAFLHLDIRFMEGRPTSVKQTIGEEILLILKREFSEAMETLDLQITVEIRDISADCYFKYPEGTLTVQ
jgi:5-carboxymethyl-2-hydroxymuconate isomerase